jgi:hypothetical protein
MIRLLTEADCKKVLDYLYEESAFNIFPIGDIETFGFDKDFQRIYGEFSEKGEYLSIFLRYRENAIYYSHQLRFNPEYERIFQDDSFKYISGKKELMELVEPYLSGFKKQKMYFCKATELLHPKSDSSYQIKTLMTEEQCHRLFDLITQITEFSISRKERSEFVEGKINSMAMGVTLFIEENEKIISTVATTAETTKSAMVVAVATDKDYRNQGLASILMKELMHLYINEKKKELCLFYDNPTAGKIYLRLGFKFIGNWNMYERESD